MHKLVKTDENGCTDIDHQEISSTRYRDFKQHAVAVFKFLSIKFSKRLLLFRPFPIVVVNF